MTEILNFDANSDWVVRFEQVLRQHDHGLSAAECHGTLTGLICAGHDNRSVNQWQNLLVLENSEVSLLDAMRDLMELTESSLESTDFCFQPIFCSTTSLPERTYALGDWCRGFTLGISWNDTSTVKSFGEDATEALSDIANIALAESGNNQPETEERALVELEEYLRVSVQLIYEDSCSSRLPSCTTNLMNHD
jgi:uncharacterized protein YgfB (UPF0149 family)